MHYLCRRLPAEGPAERARHGLTKAIAESGGPPVFLLLADPHPAAAVEMRDAGATDCMLKPFLIGELAARLRKLVRQDLARRGLAAGVHADGLDIDFVRWRVHVNGRDVPLTQKEQTILRWLVQEAEGAVSTRSLFEHIWGYDLPPDNKELNPVVGCLRRTLGLQPGGGVQPVADAQLGDRLVLRETPTPFYSAVRS